MLQLQFLKILVCLEDVANLSALTSKKKSHRKLHLTGLELQATLFQDALQILFINYVIF
jgi:hypothetical protein